MCSVEVCVGVCVHVSVCIDMFCCCLAALFAEIVRQLNALSSIDGDSDEDPKHALKAACSPAGLQLSALTSLFTPSRTLSLCITPLSVHFFCIVTLFIVYRVRLRSEPCEVILGSVPFALYAAFISVLSCGRYIFGLSFIFLQFVVNQFVANLSPSLSGLLRLFPDAGPAPLCEVESFLMYTRVIVAFA